MYSARLVKVLELERNTILNASLLEELFGPGDVAIVVGHRVRVECTALGRNQIGFYAALAERDVQQRCPIDGVVHRLPHARVAQRRLGVVEQHHVRRRRNAGGQAEDLHVRHRADLFDPRQRHGVRELNPASLQEDDLLILVRSGQEHQLVEIRQAPLVVSRKLLQAHALVAHPLHKREWPGANRVGSIEVLRNNHQIGSIHRERRVGRLEVDANRHGVDHGGRSNLGGTRLERAGCAGLRCNQTVHAELDRIRSHRLTVVERQSAAQLEGPAFGIRRGPRLGQRAGGCIGDDV